MTSWFIETLAATSLLMLVVLAIRIPVARHFGPRIAYGLWLLPALRLLLPPLPEAVTPAPLQVLPSVIDIEALLAMPAAADPVAEPAIAWALLFACLWGAGALLFLAWHIHSYRRFVRTALGQATQLPRFDRDGVEVCASPAAHGPFAAGIFLKTIVLPHDYRRRYEREELRLAIEHEVQHHRRGDMSANFAALIVLALHWWNPIAHFAHRAFRIDQELACDAVVLADATPAERHAYGSALLKSACDRLPVAACALGAGDDLKRRLRMMKTYQWNPARARLGRVLAAGLVGGGLMLTASNGIAAETTKKMEEQVRTALAPVIAPTPPTPVTAPAPLAPVDVAQAPLPPRAPVAPVPPRSPVASEAPDVDEDIDIDVDVDVDGMDTAWVDHAAIARHASIEVAAATQGAAHWVDHRRIAREVAAELRREMPRVRAEVARATAEARAAAREASETCGKASHTVSMRIHGKEGKRVIQCRGWSAADRAQMRKTMIVSLERARASIAAMDKDVLVRQSRERALEEVDRKLAELRAEK